MGFLPSWACSPGRGAPQTRQEPWRSLQTSSPASSPLPPHPRAEPPPGSLRPLRSDPAPNPARLFHNPHASFPNASHALAVSRMGPLTAAQPTSSPSPTCEVRSLPPRRLPGPKGPQRPVQPLAPAGKPTLMRLWRTRCVPHVRKRGCSQGSLSSARPTQAERRVGSPALPNRRPLAHSTPSAPLAVPGSAPPVPRCATPVPGPGFPRPQRALQTRSARSPCASWPAARSQAPCALPGPSSSRTAPRSLLGPPLAPLAPARSPGLAPPGPPRAPPLCSPPTWPLTHPPGGRTGTRPRHPAGSPGSRLCPRRCRPPART